MLIRPHGCRSGTHTVLLGQWDPTTAAHEALFRQSVAAAEVDPVLVVTFDPEPVALLFGSKARPPFDDVAARLAVQARCGVQSRLVVSLTETEVRRAGVEELLEALADHVDLGTLVLGAKQTLGTMGRGNDAAVRASCARRDITLRRLPRQAQRSRTPDARAALIGGRLAEAVELVGRPLIWGRPSGREVTIPWPAGRYRALPLAQPEPGTELARPLELDLAPTPEGSVLRWPADDPPWLGFVAGPADRMGALAPVPFGSGRAMTR